MQTDMRSGLEKEIKKYLRDIKYLLPADAGTKKKFLSGLESEIYESVADKENVSMDDIIDQFGTSADVAKAFIDSADIKYIRKRLSIKRVISFVLIAALLVWVIGFTVACVVSKIEAENGYFVEYMYEGEPDGGYYRVGAIAD